jgi:hypothetical protein
MGKLALPALVVVIVAAMIGIFALGNSGSSTSQTKSTLPTSAIADPSNLDGLLTSGPPWPANTDQLKSRLDALSLPALSAEGTVLHIHQHIDIYVDGQPVSVAQGIGINQSQNFISTIHTHDNSGVIHVESPEQHDFFLGQFFDIWGVKFTKDVLGNNVSRGDKKIQVFVDGQPYNGDPRQLKLQAHQEIVVAYGTASQLPNPVPSTYNFPRGE